MAKQGERYDPKTKTGWKFENGQSNYYVKGKKLSQIEIVKRGLAQGGENIKGFASDVFAPLTSGAQTLKAKMTRDPRSSIGDNVWTHNKKLLALQAQLDKDPKVIANQQALAASQSPAEFFGTNQYGDRNAQITNEIQASNSSPIGKLTIGVDGEIDPQLRQALGMETGQMMDGQNFVPTTYEPGSVNQAYANTSSARESTLGDALTTDQIESNIEQGSGGGETATGGGNKIEGETNIVEPTEKAPETKKQRWAGNEKDGYTIPKPTSIQKDLLKAGFTEDSLARLMINHEKNYGKRGNPIKAIKKLLVKK